MKRALKISAILIAALVVIAIALPFLVDVNTFRPRLESELTDALGRQVKVGNLALSVFSRGVTADDISIADDPAFGTSAFVRAKSLKVGVELIPLIFSKSLHVTELTLKQPEISLLRSQDGGKWNFSSLGSRSAAAKPVGQSSQSNPDLAVAKLNVNDGRLTLARAGSSESPRVYDKVNIKVTGFSMTGSFPFTMSASLPSGGSLKLDGTSGPVNSENAALTPLQAKVEVRQMNLATSGFIDPASGISGIADFDGTVTSDGHSAKTAGTLKVVKLQVVRKGSPAGKPVQVQYAVEHDLRKQVGRLTQGDVAMGNAVQHLTGTYDSSGTTTSVNMKLAGQAMPVDDLEAMLPALGVVLPSGSRLKGGTLGDNISIAGPVDKLVATGAIRLSNAALAGFNLGSKLAAVSALSGKNTGGNDTVIQNFSSDVRVAPEGMKADNINLLIPAFGVLTGAGTVSPTNALNFKMNASLGGTYVTGLTQLAGLGSNGASIAFFIQGTASNPKFVPDMQSMARGLVQGALSGNQGGQQTKNPLGKVMGLFKKKKQK
ncbi:MAG: AsmA family protein [Candidatus Sulfotelmatobacter sp.]